MLDIASINTAPDAARLSVGLPKKDASLAASVGPTTTVTSDGPDLWHRLWGKDGFSFATLLDIVNPLQHIPVVSTVYQKLTGDVASPGADLVGGALFGGPIGFALAAADSSIKNETGKDIGDHVLALFDSGTGDAPTAVAQAGDPSPAPAKPPITSAAASSAEAAARDAAPKASDAAPASSEKQETAAADNDATDPKPAPSPVAAATEAGDDKAPSADAKADKDAPPKPTAAAAPVEKAPKSAFVLAHSSPRSYSGKGAGSAFVPLETRSTIMPAAYFAPPPIGAPEDAKSAQSSQPFPPDPKTLAADPALLRRFQAAKGATPLPQPTDAAAAAADPSGFAALMARNLERYMALHNKGAAPKVDKRF
ncbi:MAG TPA: hypothetical protein VFX03_16715 [Thermomicrobiales bacterium]|nr:hypothetical protein [Thermomicrobiales bacterium]